MNTLALMVKFGFYMVPGFIFGEIGANLINEQTLVPLKIAVGIAAALVTVLVPMLWKSARALQRFVDELKLMRQNISSLHKSFGNLYCVRNAECIEKGENDHE